MATSSSSRMLLLLLSACFLLSLMMPPAACAPAEDPKENEVNRLQTKYTTRAEQEEYLDRLQYFGTEVLTEAKSRSDEVFMDAIKELQRMGHINVTGVADDDTITLMNTPRCGLPDPPQQTNLRKKRFVAPGSKWRSNSLTYRITRYTSDLSRTIVDNIIAQAFNMWSDICGLDFAKRSTAPADIDILFASGYHGDRDTFDGPGGQLAHAYFPQNGDTHFDDGERWTSRSSDGGTSLLQVATHEFGHAIGLDHSNAQGAVMNPYYNGYEANFNLGQDDINGAQYLYGAARPVDPPEPDPEDPDPPPPPPPPGNTPRICRRTVSIDAIFQEEDGKVYALKGQNIYQLLITKRGVVEGFPVKLADQYPSLPNERMHAALHWPAIRVRVSRWQYKTYTARTYFFKKNQYWRFENYKLVAGYPKAISTGFPGLPNAVDAALLWADNIHSYFYKGGQYYRFSRLESATQEASLDSGYPQPLSKWTGLPTSVNAAFNLKYPDGHILTYFFKDEDYYRFNGHTVQVDPGYPRDIGYWWFGCPDSAALVAGGDSAGRRPCFDLIVLLLSGMLLAILA